MIEILTAQFQVVLSIQNSVYSKWDKQQLLEVPFHITNVIWSSGFIVHVKTDFKSQRA